MGDLSDTFSVRKMQLLGGQRPPQDLLGGHRPLQETAVGCVNKGKVTYLYITAKVRNKHI